ncbi:MAG: hypothetical protein DLM61_20700 [Pseudonocardiales bacterium]|nr:MAG: hypothetical protein DLM61_20700 [Pseudonocardiales bacterium]
MPVRFLSDAQREQLSGFPAELDDEALDRFFTLSGADVAEARRCGEGNGRIQPGLNANGVPLSTPSAA